ncbi:hypothetical protein Sgleb_06110 [Streptomyces glebosus]|uniref:Uncharacterized protein n=1 Tax=Streptomyces glebosus TaxID=249580 RepID=A0A640SNT7_9ACTN|nr:hypothetical protein Sgleb_06110 [Streptomyces glebosus]GHG71314.1 hypothetical protein GCM10010513_43320 [Streptomyces glebosus]
MWPFDRLVVQGMGRGKRGDLSERGEPRELHDRPDQLPVSPHRAAPGPSGNADGLSRISAEGAAVALVGEA